MTSRSNAFPILNAIRFTPRPSERVRIRGLTRARARAFRIYEQRALAILRAIVSRPLNKSYTRESSSRSEQCRADLAVAPRESRFGARSLRRAPRLSKFIADRNKNFQRRFVPRRRVRRIARVFNRLRHCGKPTVKRQFLYLFYRS